VRADPAFRERLKHAFVTGSVAGRTPAAARAGAHPRGWGLWWVLAPAAAAALLALFAVANRGPAWTIAAGRGGGTLWVDGVPVPANDVVELARHVRAGATLRLSPDGEVDLVCAGELALQVTAGSEMTIPEPPGRWLRRTVRATVERGEVRFVTGPRFTGSRLRVETPEALVVVTGTTLAVIRDTTGTCVCVWSGRVEFGPRRGTPEPVAAGKRRVLYADGRPPLTEDLGPGERMKLDMFQGRGEALLR
jgi:hypothetical protein